jgi:DNA polymerase (family 10)
MPGVGEKLRAKIDQILSTGTCDELESLIAQYGDLRELMEIGGVGQVTARDLYVTHGCRTVEDVRRLVDSSVVTNKAIIASLAMIGRRIPRADAQPVADKIAAAFDDLVAKGHRFDFCGSWRRQRSDIKDFDVLTDAPHAAVRAVVSQFGPLAEDGESKMGVVVDGIKLEVRFVTPPQYGSAMLHLTGSWQFNARMRAVAKSKGYKLNEYGLFDATDKCITSESEEAIFKALGMDFVVPIGRE